MEYDGIRDSAPRDREEWRAIYEREAALIASILRDELIFIEHVGSTAIPDLGSAPDISAMDILAIVRNEKSIDCYETAFKMSGYHELPGGKFLKKGGRGVRIHIFPEEHPTMMGMLDVRDYLLAHPDEARKYKEAKEKWSRKHHGDRGGYQEEKDEYLAKLSSRASNWKGTHLPETGE